MTESSHQNGRDPEQWIGAAVVSVLFVVSGSILITKGVRGLYEGALYVAIVGRGAAPLTPSHAVMAGTVAFILGIYAGWLARKTKDRIDRKY